MSKEQIKQCYERIEKLLNGASKKTYGFAPEEIRQILRWYEVLQQENQSLKDRIEKGIEYIKERTEFNQYSEVYPSVLDAREVKRLLEILKGDK